MTRARRSRSPSRRSADRPTSPPGRPPRPALGRADPAAAGQRRPLARLPADLLAVNVGGLEAATRSPGFPTDSYLDFALAITFIQGALFATTNAGTDLARDIQTGFLNRLALTPMRRRVAARPARRRRRAGASPGDALPRRRPVAGVRPESGVLGVFVLIVFLGVLIALGFGALGAFLGLRTGSGEAIQALFPLFFVFLFLSSMNLPRNLIEIDWFRTVATINPVSYLIEGIRSLIIIGLGRPGARARLRAGAGSPRSGSPRRASRCGKAGAVVRAFVRSRSGSPGAGSTTPSRTRPSSCRRSSSRSSSSRPSPVGSRASPTCRGSTTRPATPRSSSSSCSSSRPPSEGSSTASASRGTSRAASPVGCCSPRPRRTGIIAGYALVALVRWAATAAVVLVVALIAGMQVLGDPVELFALVLARAPRQRRGAAVGGRGRHALPHAPGGPAHAGARLPDALPRAGVRPARAPERAGSTRSPR